jgi:hypothetical protein
VWVVMDESFFKIPFCFSDASICAIVIHSSMDGSWHIAGCDIIYIEIISNSITDVLLRPIDKTR